MLRRGDRRPRPPCCSRRVVSGIAVFADHRTYLAFVVPKIGQNNGSDDSRRRLRALCTARARHSKILLFRLTLHLRCSSGARSMTVEFVSCSMMLFGRPCRRIRFANIYGRLQCLEDRHCQCPQDHMNSKSRLNARPMNGVLTTADSRAELHKPMPECADSGAALRVEKASGVELRIDVASKSQRIPFISAIAAKTLPARRRKSFRRQRHQFCEVFQAAVVLPS